MYCCESSSDCITRYQVLGYYFYKSNICTLVSLDLLSGKTHQIRTHMK